MEVPFKNGTLVVLGDWNAKVGEDALKNWKGTCGRYCNQRTNERGFCWGIHSANTKHPKRCPIRIKFDLEKLKDPQVPESFQAMIGGMIDW